MWPGRGDLRAEEVGTVMGSLEGDDGTGRSWGRAQFAPFVFLFYAA